MNIFIYGLIQVNDTKASLHFNNNAVCVALYKLIECKIFINMSCDAFEKKWVINCAVEIYR